MAPRLGVHNMRVMIHARTLFFLFGLGAFACGQDKGTEDSTTPLMSFDTGHMRIVTKSDTLHLTVELARTRDEQTMGLMERTQLADSAGMVFLYDADQPATTAFWMFRTKIPLDIAFVDSMGVIGSIKHMTPCTTATAQNCPTYPADVAYRAALEVNAGWFAKHKVSLGDRLVLSDVRK
jgi:uncharacterized membrane protein (UPF0127 family)